MHRVGRGQIVLKVLIFSLALVIVIAPAAVAAWMDPETLSPVGRNAFDPQVAVDADGDAVFVWRRSDGTKFRAQARARAADGTLSPVQTLSAAGQDVFQPQVAVDADGDAVFVWRRFDGTKWRIQAQARTAAGTLSAVQTLSAAGQDALSPQVAIDGDGDAVIVWERQDASSFWRVQVRTRMATGTLSAVQTLSAPGGSANDSQVGVDPDGDAVITWTRFDGSNWLIEVLARTATGTLSAAQTVSATGQDAAHSQVAVEGDGDAVIVWERQDGSLDWRIQARARTATGMLSAVQNLSAAGQDALQPQVGVDADGDAVFVWRRFDAASFPFRFRTQARARTAAGALSAIQTLSIPDFDAFDPEIGVDATGAAVILWRRWDGSKGQIESRARSATGSLSAIQPLSPAGQDALGPEVGVDADGDAVAVWKLFDGTYHEIQATAGP